MPKTTDLMVQVSALKYVDELIQWLSGQGFDRSECEYKYGIEVFKLLVGLGVDKHAQICGFLQAILPLSVKEKETITKQYGGLVIQMLDSVEQLDKLPYLSCHEVGLKGVVSEENLRKMLITMVSDVRVVLIKLADQLCRMRNLKIAPAKVCQDAGRLTLTVYAPLANRLGIWQLKWELEDLAFRCTQPDDYHRLAAKLDDTRKGREAYIERLISEIGDLLRQSNVKGQAYGRPKHIYSIWSKMKRKGLSFESLSDIRAVRILVDDVADCYTVLGVVHTRWRHIPGEFDDYIATSKKNDYRSIHTVVIGPEKKQIEIQIRTYAMHEENELGIAAHWRYKENKEKDDSIDNKILWLRQLLEWKDELIGSSDFVDQYQQSIETDTVYVFTPRGTVIDLPNGSTPIDFAYAIHTEVGHRTRGARVNAKMVPLSTQLDTGDQVEIQTVKVGQPSRDWIRSDLGYTKTQRARSRIQHWFKQIDRDQHVAAGRQMLDKELKRLGLDSISYDKIAQQSKFTKVEDLMAALANGEYKLARAIAPFKEILAPKPDLLLKKVRATKTANINQGFSVHGVGNLLTHMAKCCHPVPGDQIVGYVTRGQGIAIHQHNCHNIMGLQDSHRDRVLDVGWGRDNHGIWPVNVKVTAYQRSGLLNDISQIIKDIKVNLLLINMSVIDECVVQIDLKLEVGGLTKLSQLLNKLEKIQNVIEVKRWAN